MNKKKALAIGSIISIFIAFVINLLLLPGDLSMITVLGSFFASSTTTTNIATLSTNFIGFIYYVLIFAVTDAFTTLIISTLKGI